MKKRLVLRATMCVPIPGTKNAHYIGAEYEEEHEFTGTKAAEKKFDTALIKKVKETMYQGLDAALEEIEVE